MINGSDPATWTAFRECEKAPQDMQGHCAEYIMRQVQPFINSIPDVDDANIYEIIQKLNERSIAYCDNSGSYIFFVQTYIFHKYSGTLLTKYPDNFDSIRPKLFLFTDYINGQYDNIEIITNILTFFNVFGYFCFFCEKTFRGKSSQHNCSKTDTCFVCKRPFLKSNNGSFEPSKFNDIYFCLSRLTVEEAKRCEKCNLIIYSKSCFKHHLSKTCKFGWFCLLCSKYIFRSKFSPNIAAIQRNHICGTKVCKICGAVFNTKCRHQCQFSPPKPMTSLPKLGFIDLQLTGSSPLFCKQCFETNSLSPERCMFCSDNDVYEPSICTIVYETERGNFSEAVSIIKPESKYGVQLLEEEQIYSDTYLPKECNMLPCEKTTFFGKIPKICIDTENMFSNQSMTPCEQIFKLIFSKKIFYTTFLTHEIENGYVLNELFKLFVKNGLQPTFTGNPKLLMLELAEFGLRFINLTNYVDTSLITISLNFNLRLPFFPHRWNKKAFFTYQGSPPDLHDYFHADDTSQIISLKQKFVQDQDTLWDFTQSLKDFSRKRTYAMLTIAIKFIKDAVICQNLLYTNITSRHDKQFYIMPFNSPLFTRASYAFQLLLLFSKNISKLKVPLPPIRMQSSKQELEFCSYLRWKFPHFYFVDAWSVNGQKRFKESFPDSFCAATKTAFYFNGCLIHGHKKDICKFKRKSTKETNYFQVPLAKARDLHESKTLELLKNHPNEVENIETVWECEWQQLKKTCPSIRDFMKNIYKEPPLSRLDVNAAGMSYNF